MNKQKFIVAILFCIFLITAGCSSGDSQTATTQLAGGNQSPDTGAKGEQQASSNSTSESQTIEPKQLISREEAAQLIGEAVKDGADQDQEILGMKICFYAAENIDSKGYIQIAIIQSGVLSAGSSKGSEGSDSSKGSGNEPGGSEGTKEKGSSENTSQESQEELSPKGIYEALKKAMKDLNAPDTGRIGDDAFISAQSMCILLGDYYIIVAAGSSDPAKVTEIVKMAGELAVRNIKRIQGK